MLNPTLCLLLLWPFLVSPCQDGWTRFHGNCYKKFSRPGIKNSQSNSVCMNHGATLASVLTDAERQFLTEFGEEGYGIYDFDQMQVGAYRSTINSNAWRWYDGSSFTQQHFFQYPGMTNRAGEYYSAIKADPYNNGGARGYLIDQCEGPAYLFVCKKKDTYTNPAGCGDYWAPFQGACYRRFSRPSMSDCRDLNNFCYNNHGSYLASVTTHAERQFIIDFGKSGRKVGKPDQWQPILGAYRTSASSQWQWFDGTPYRQYDFWHAGTPTSVSDRTCMRIKADAPSKWSYSGLGPSGYFFDIAPKWKAFVFICKKKICHYSMYFYKGDCVCKSGMIDIVDSASSIASSYKRGQRCVECDASMTIQGGKCVCKANHIDIVDSGSADAKNYGRGQKCVTCDSSMTIQSGKCVCKPELIDIVDSYLPEADTHTRGQKCVEKGKCYSVKDKTSILFMVDSSVSITDKHWPKMVNFVKSGAKMMPNTFRVGFMKFSTAISEKQWLEPNWSQDEYRDAVPYKYDHGDTDTPLALQEAKKMFRNDDNKNRIAVLITDGMPFAEQYDSQDAAQNATIKAAKSLQRDGVRLTVMGVGRDVKAIDIKEWLKNPRKDYLSFNDNVDCLKGSDMGNLLQLVCDFD